MANVGIMDIMQGITALVQGLQQNMDRGQDQELKALMLLAQQPGMQLTQAQDAQPANVFQRLLGLPAYQPGAGGHPVTAIGQTPFTVTEGPSTKDFAAQILKTLPSSAGVRTTGPAAVPTALPTTGDADFLPEATVQARREQYPIAHFRVTQEQANADPQLQYILKTRGDQRGLWVKRLYEMEKDNMERAKFQREGMTAGIKQETDSRELIGRYYAGVTSQATLNAANAHLQPILPPQVYAALPMTYDPAEVQAVMRTALSVEAQTASSRAAEQARVVGPVETQVQVARREALGPVELRQKVAEDAATLPGKVAISSAQGREAANRAYEATLAKNRAEMENAPLGEAMAERISNLNTLIGFLNQISALREKNFTGRVAGPLGTVREFTGDIANNEVQFRALLLDATDMLGRIRSQGAITRDEESRFLRMMPTPNLPPAVFVARMEGFGKAVEIARDEKIKMAITPRGKLLETSPRMQPAPQYPTPRQRQGAGLPAATTVPEPPMLREQAIERLMQAMGWTRARAEAELNKAPQIPATVP